MAEFRTYYPTNDGRLLTADELVAENERLREALRTFADRIERDRRESDKLLTYAQSMRRVADDLNQPSSERQEP